jgi:hypothetical protein
MLSVRLFWYVLVLCLANVCAGQVRPCLPSVTGDGHPIFGAISTRLDYEGFIGTPTSVRVADFNGDGIPDIAVTLMERHVVAVAFGIGDGRFQNVAYYATGAHPIMLAIAELNGDRRPDIAVINQNGKSISVLLNNGDGSFAPAVHYPVGPRPRSIVAGDLTGSGRPDLAVLNMGDQTVSILRNLGDGALAAETRVHPGFTTTAEALPGPGPHLALGDFSGNGRLDLVVPQQHRVLIMLNDGQANFTPGPTAVLNDSSAYAMAVADLDNDARADLAVITSRASLQTLHILLNRGDGTFHPAASYDAAPRPPPGWFMPSSIAAADLDRNGFVDLVIGHEAAYGFATLLRNRGDGSFHPKEIFATDEDSQPIELHDLDGDGYPDWVITGAYVRATAKVLLNDRTGRPMTVSTPPVSMPGPVGVAADLNGNGRPDLVIGATIPQYQLSVARNDGGSFAPLPPMALAPTGSARTAAIAVGDLSGNGIPDIVVSDVVIPNYITLTQSKVHILFGLGNLEYAPPVTYNVPGYAGNLAIADFTRNGARDIAVWVRDPYPGDDQTPVPIRIVLLANDGSGGFTTGGNYILESLPFTINGPLIAADVDGDTHPDLIAGWGSRDVAGRIGVLRNRGDGTFESPQIVETARMPQSIVAGDLRRTGRTDLAVMHNLNWWIQVVNHAQTPYLTILYNDGGGSFPVRQEFANAATITDRQMSAADVNGSGLLDLVLPDLGARGVIVHLNQGDGMFGPGQRYAGANTVIVGDVIASDFDGNGRFDIVVLMPSPRGHFIARLRNVGCRPDRCYANCDGSTIVPVLNVEDFACFISEFAMASGLPHQQQLMHYANCDGSTLAPVLNVEDFTCFLNAFAAGCR